jgi:O-antigen ligase
MIRDVPLEQLVPLAFAAITSLVLFVILSRRFHPLYLLACAFILLAPLSAAPGLSISNAAKYARVGVGFLMVLVGLVGFRPKWPGAASVALMAFAVFYIFAAVWGPDPISGVFYKSFFGATLLGGLFMAYNVRSRQQLDQGLRLIGMTAGFAGLFLFMVYLANPTGERMSVGGLNPNRIGQDAAPLLILCAHLAIYDRSRAWKVFAFFVCGLMILIVVLTGSRASAAMAIIGGAIVVAPLVKRPPKLLLAFALVAAATYLAMNVLQQGETHLTREISVESRVGPWSLAVRCFRSSPVIGIGWARSEGGTTGNLHSMYLQIAAETGLAGILLFSVCLGVIAFSGLRLFRYMRRNRALTNFTGLPLGLVLGVLAHGFAESSVLGGTTLVTLLLGFGVGLIDRLPALVFDEAMQRYYFMAYYRRRLRAGSQPS